jgi:hypothetical protein
MEGIAVFEIDKYYAASQRFVQVRGYLLLLTFQDATNLFYGDELPGLEPSADL